MSLGKSQKLLTTPEIVAWFCNVRRRRLGLSATKLKIDKGWTESAPFFDADKVPASTIEATGSDMMDLTPEQYRHRVPKKPTI